MCADMLAASTLSHDKRASFASLLAAHIYTLYSGTAAAEAEAAGLPQVTMVTGRDEAAWHQTFYQSDFHASHWS
jgi:hypothetical protein